MSPALESGLCGCLNNMEVMVGQSLDPGRENCSLHVPLRMLALGTQPPRCEEAQRPHGTATWRRTEAPALTPTS